MSAVSLVLDQGTKPVPLPNQSIVENSTYEFASVKSSSLYFPKVEEMFRTHIEPLYGNQDGALRKIRDRADRRCEILLQNKTDVVGLIVYKTESQQEYAEQGLVDSFELKSLITVESDKKAVKAYRKMLIDRVVKLAQRKFAKSVHLTISERSPTMLQFLSKRGFSMGPTWQDKYIEGVKEQLMYFKLPEKKSGIITKAAEMTSKTEQSSTKERDASPDNGLKRRREQQEDDSQRKEGRSEGVSVRKRQFETRDRRDDSRSHRPSFSSAARFSSATGPKFHELTLKPKYIHQIQSGRKTIEGRIKSGVILQYKAGDQIRFFYQQNQSDDAACDIIAIRPYNSFKRMLEAEGFERCLTDVASLEEAVRVYDQIPGYADRAAKCGVVAIQLQYKNHS